MFSWPYSIIVRLREGPDVTFYIDFCNIARQIVLLSLFWKAYISKCTFCLLLSLFKFNILSSTSKKQLIPLIDRTVCLAQPQLRFI